jgi:predicted phage terminase large subunit-like protein
MEISNILTSIDQYPKLLAGLLKLPESERVPHLRNLCRTDLYFLLRYVLGRKDLEHPWLFARCREVQLSPDGHIDLWSREHYKSTIITFGKTLQDILASHGDNPLVDRECCIGIFSHTRPNSKGFLRQIKRELESNIQLKAWFPDVLWANPYKEAPKWSEDDGLIVRRKGNPKEATLEAWGLVDGQPIGKHFTHLVYDDVVTAESVTTPEMIQKTTTMTELSYALGAMGGIRRAIGTRYHFGDTYKTLMDRGTFKPRLYPATEDGSPTGVPVLLTAEQLAEKRRDMGPYTFSSQMLMNPTADESQGFKQEWLRYHDGIRRDGLNVYITVDPANSKRKTSDFTAIWVIGIGPDRNWYVLDIVRDRLNLTQRAATLMRLHRKWKPVRDTGVRYEKYGLQADIEHIQYVQQQQNYRFEITEVGGQVPKNDRIKRLVPYYEQGRIYLPRSLHYTGSDGKTVDLVQDFVEQEFKPFPVPIHDDLLDAQARLAEPDLPLIYPDEDNDVGDTDPPAFND